MKRLWLIGLLALLPSLAAGQGVVSQSGSVVVGHAPAWSVNRVQRDAGSADGNGPGLTELLQVNPLLPLGSGPDGTHVCLRDAPVTIANHFLCFDAGALGGGLIDYGAANGAPLQPLSCRINGNTYSCVNTGNGNIVGPNSSTVGNIASFNNNTGTLIADFNTPLTGVARNFVRLLFPIGFTGSTVPGVVITPDGSAIPGLNSTVTGGFNEVEAQAFIKGWSVEVVGTGEFSGEGSGSLRSYLVTNDVGGFILKPMSNRVHIWRGIQFLCLGNANAGCINIDSMVKGKIICDGCEIGSLPTTGDVVNEYAIYLNPHTAVPNEGTIGINDSEIDLGNLTTQPGTGTAHASIGMNIGLGGINTNIIRANEPNSGGAGFTPTANYDIFIGGANGTFSFVGNRLSFNHVHLAKLAGIQIGASASFQTSYSGNIWDVGVIYPGFAGTQGINTFGQNDQFRVGVINNGENVSGNFQTPIFTHQGATNNTFNVGVTNGASNGVGCASIIDQTNGAATPAYQNNYTLNGVNCNSLSPTGQINELVPATLTAGTGAVCSAAVVCTNHKGTIDVGTGNPTSIVISFSIVYLIPPTCTVGANASGMNFYKSAYVAGGGGFTGVQYLTSGAVTMPQHTLVDYKCE